MQGKLRKAFGVNKKFRNNPKVQHNIVIAPERGFNHKIERLHNTIRDRTKIMCGIAILSQANHVERIDANTYRVRSQSGNGSYLVRKVGLKWVCECPDHQFRRVKCKYIHAVRLNIRE